MPGSSSKHHSTSKGKHNISGLQNSDLTLIDPYSLLGFGAALALIDNEEDIAHLLVGAIISALRVQLGAVVLQNVTGRATSIQGQYRNAPLEKALAEEIKSFLFSNTTDSSALYYENNREIKVRKEHLPEATIAGLNRLLLVRLRTIEHDFGVVIAGKSSDEPYSPGQTVSLEALASQTSMALHRIQLNRERAANEAALRESKEKLTCILESAMDAIITIDEARHIILFNEAAEKVFRCPAKKAINKPFDQFLSERLLHLLKKNMQDLGKGSKTKLYMLAPEDLTAIRADGEEFPIEATISQFEMYGQKLFTIILRDINERKKAEEELNRLHLEKLYLQEEIKIEHNFEEIISCSKVFKKVLRKIEQVAATDATVLILGETGTGTELVAHAVHNISSRRDRPLIKVNCAALPANLIESELFGHEKGAFTGATSKKIGRFELADSGTIFLDEIGDLPMELQGKLLRVLQEGEFERLGNPHTIKVDVRVIAATNRNLEKVIENGDFREDLYYRLNVFPIKIPPLRERKEDIPLMVKYFCDKFGKKIGKKIESVDQKAMDALLAYNWPGNVRELENIIERTVIITSGNKLQLGDWVPVKTKASSSTALLTLEENEKKHIIEALELTGGRVSGERGAAKVLGINSSTLESRMRKLGIK